MRGKGRGLQNLPLDIKYQTCKAETIDGWQAVFTTQVTCHPLYSEEGTHIQTWMSNHEQICSSKGYRLIFNVAVMSWPSIQSVPSLSPYESWDTLHSPLQP